MRPPTKFENPNCYGTDAESFFPEATHTTENEAAKRICSNCDHISECLEWALHHEDSGIWGGMTARDRGRLRSRRGIVLRQVHLELLPNSVRFAS